MPACACIDRAQIAVRKKPRKPSFEINQPGERCVAEYLDDFRIGSFIDKLATRAECVKNDLVKVFPNRSQRGLGQACADEVSAAHFRSELQMKSGCKRVGVRIGLLWRFSIGAACDVALVSKICCKSVFDCPPAHLYAIAHGLLRREAIIR